MADIELVIKIPEELYETLKNPEILSTMYHASRVADAVRSGTPLPKGHGRLIDADALMEYCQNDKSKAFDCNDIARFPTIIEAESEDK